MVKQNQNTETPKHRNTQLPSEKVILAYALENALKYNGKASQGSVLAGLFAEGLEKSEIPKIMPKVLEVLKKVNSMSLEDQEKEFNSLEIQTSKREIREGLPPLENAEEKNVVMRLAPFPSGPLHIGNARSMILNDEYTKMYKGRLLLVYDDTIGSSNKMIEPEAYDLIKEGLDWLKIKYDKKILYKSDRTAKYHEYAKELLEKGYFYVCDCSQEKMQNLKREEIECDCRNLGPEIQLKRWEKMQTAEMGSMTVRIKTSMQDPDPAFRDRVMMKISDLKHPRTGDKFRVYPSMEFSWGIDDHIFGSTHVLRGTDHHLSTRIQNFIRGIFGWENPTSVYNGICEISGVKISKSKGTQKIKSGEYTGWNDPRTWSMQSLRDRGIKPEAIREFILGLGMSKANITVPVENLYIINKKLIQNSPRYFFVENPVKIKISGCPELKAKIPRHPNQELNLGFKTYKTTQEFLISESDFEFLEDKNYRLMHLLTFNSSKTGLNPRTFSYLDRQPTTDNRQPKFLPWLPAKPDNINVTLRMPDGSLKEGKGEYELEKIKVGEMVYFEKIGFARLHKKEKEQLEFWFTHS